MKKNKVFEEDYFEGYYKGISDFSKEKDKHLSNWFRAIFEQVGKLTPIKEGKEKRLIEFGCATGAASYVLKKFGYDVYATDISNYAIKRASKNYPDIKFLIHDMQKAYPKKNYFDVAVALDVIEHLEEPEVALKNIYDMLKPNGSIILSTPNDYKHVSNDPTHINVKLPKEWSKILYETGFQDLKVKQVTFLPFLYRMSWRFGIALPIAVASSYFISPVIITGKKRR